ncbi:MAG: ABC transporter permease [Planctomycetota bacterium]|nr:MAG: ABC transporter permease [Planctomycetota bacterium]
MNTYAAAARAFPSLLKTGLAEMVSYRVELVIWALTATMPLLMMFIWDRVAATGPVGGYDQNAFAGYFAGTLIVRQLTTAWVVWDLNEQIRTGSISPALLKPLGPLWLSAAENLAAVPFRMLVLVPIITCICLWRPELALGLAWADVPAAAAALALGWMVYFFIQVCFGALCFYTEQSGGIYMGFYGLFTLFSGYLFPLDLMPAGILSVVQWLPFRAIIQTPVSIITGQLHGAAVLAPMAHQLAWAVICAALARWSWRHGIRRYEAYGA